MTDELAPEVEDTPTPDAPAAEPEGTREPEAPDASTPDDTDYEKRYNDLRPEYDRTNQFVGALQGRYGAEAQAEALRQIGDEDTLLGVLGYEPGDDDADEDDFEDEFRDPRVDQLLELEQQREQEAHLDQLESHIDTQIDELAKSAKVTLTDNEKNLIFFAVGEGQDGLPDVESAFKTVTGLRDEAIKSYKEKAKQAPSPPAKGSGSGEPSQPLTSRKDRLSAGLEAVNKAFASSG